MTFEHDRAEKLQSIRNLGVDPYGEHFAHSEMCLPLPLLRSLCFDGTVLKTDIDKHGGPIHWGSGRIVLHRAMGNLHFVTVRSDNFDLQVAFSKKMLDETEWKLVRLLDLGDSISFSGTMAPTQVGEPTCWVRPHVDYRGRQQPALIIMSKCLVPVPDKHEGLVDVESRYRNRHIDFVYNTDAAAILRRRFEIVKNIRTYLYRDNFYEVETPILQTKAGGAIAEPFATHHKAMDTPMYLRVAPELYLKRCIMGGFNRVFEMGRNFRNEGVSTKHNPEFTSLELYQVHGNIYTIMKRMQNIYEWAKSGDFLTNPDDEPNFVSLTDVVEAHLRSNNLSSMVGESLETYHTYYENHVEQTLIEPLFITGFPEGKVPLAKSIDGVAQAAEFVIGGMEIGCCYVEENDPAEQLRKFEQQGTEIDHDYLAALQFGLPSCTGLGIGIDRLAMVLTKSASIKDVILFPAMKQEKID